MHLFPTFSLSKTSWLSGDNIRDLLSPLARRYDSTFLWDLDSRLHGPVCYYVLFENNYWSVENPQNRWQHTAWSYPLIEERTHDTICIKFSLLTWPVMSRVAPWTLTWHFNRNYTRSWWHVIGSVNMTEERVWRWDVLQYFHTWDASNILFDLRVPWY